MFAVMGITGQVGSAIANCLLSEGRKVRAIVRNAGKAAVWSERGCAVAIADVNDVAALAEGFKDVEGAFVMLPPIFDPSHGFPEARLAITAIQDALQQAGPAKVVVLSTIGGHIATPNLLNQLHLLEESLRSLLLPIAILRPAWFMENSAWDIAPAREHGIVPSFLQPLDKPFPMIGTRDIGRVAADLLMETSDGQQIVQIEGPTRISPCDIAAGLAQLLHRDVRVEAIPRDTWEPTFRGQGMKNPTPRMQMLDGFNEGWIEFDGGEAASRKTETPMTEVLRSLL